MFTLWIVGICLQCALLFTLLLRGGRLLVKPGDGRPAPPPLSEKFPVAGMIVPAAGVRPGMEAALRSLLSQDYPRYAVVFVTAEEDDPAADLARMLCGEFTHARHAAAGRASVCGQKNHNLLRGIAELGDETEIYVFCDSTHTAQPDFLRKLIRPLAAGESSFSTGYHTVDAADARPLTLAYQMTVIFMRLLQAVSAFTQPWGGAMAITRTAFARYEVAELWANTVVDDCSLAGLLMTERVHVRLCPEALLRTPAARHSRTQWKNWFERQVLFLKFCTPSMWRLMGLGIFLLAAPTLCTVAVALCSPALGFDPLLLPAAGHMLFLSFVAGGLRGFTEKKAPFPVWLAAFALNMWMVVRVYAYSVFVRKIRWHDTVYRVGRGGRVLGLERR